MTGTPTTGGGDAAFPVRLPGGLAGRAPTALGAYAVQTFNVSTTPDQRHGLDVSGELNSSFLDKKLLLDVRLGWHHQLDEGPPGDGSGFDNIHNLNTLAGIPSLQPLVRQQRARPRGPGSGERQRRPCGTGDRTTKCQTSWNSLRWDQLPRAAEARLLPGRRRPHLPAPRARPPRASRPVSTGASPTTSTPRPTAAGPVLIQYLDGNAAGLARRPGGPPVRLPHRTSTHGGQRASSPPRASR